MDRLRSHCARRRLGDNPSPSLLITESDDHLFLMEGLQKTAFRSSLLLCFPCQATEKWEDMNKLAAGFDFLGVEQ